METTPDLTEIEDFLRNKQVYLIRDIVNPDMRTIAQSGKVYDIGEVEAKLIRDDIIALSIEINGEKPTLYDSFRSVDEYMEYLEKCFIPVRDMLSAYYKLKQNKTTKPLRLQ